MSGLPSWSGDSKQKTDIKSWSKYPMISSFSGAGFNITNLNNIQLSTINSLPYPLPDNTSNWASFRAITRVDISNNPIINVSTINGSVFPQIIPEDNTFNWATFRANHLVDISNNPIINVSTINGTVFPQIIPEDNTFNWATFRANHLVDISNNPIINVSTINGSVFPQIIPADRAPLWATFNAVQTVDISNNGLINVSSINGEPFISLSNWASFPASQTVNFNNFPIINVSTINGSIFPQIIPPSPPDNTSNWSQFPARTNINMSNFSIVNLNQINGSNYPPLIPVQNPDRWSQYPAIQNVNMANFNLSNAFNGVFNNQITIGNIFKTNINGGDIDCYNINVGNLLTQQADVNIYGLNLPPSDSALYVQGGTTLDGGGTIHGITIGTLPAGGINTQRIDVLPTGITVTTPTLFTVLGLGAISLNVAGAGNFAVGGPLSLSAGQMIEMNTSNVRMLNTSFGNQNTSLNVGRIDGPSDVNNQFPLILGNTGGAGTHIENLTQINGEPYPPPAPPPSVSSFPSQTLLDVKPMGTNGGDAFNYLNVFGTRELNTGIPVLTQTNNTIFESTTIIGLVLDTSNGRISLPPGNYLIDVFCPVLSVGNHKCRLEDIDTNTTLAIGNNGFTDTNNFTGASSTLSASFSVSVQTSVMIQQQIGVTGLNPQASMGFPTNFQGVDEIYTTVRLVRIGDALPQ